MRFKIVPTIIAKNSKEFTKRYNELKNITTWAQVDVMDGKFVINHSNDFKIRIPKGKLKLEVHLMVDEPEKWTKKYYKNYEVILANIERVKNPKKFITFLKSKGKKVGFALNPETPLETVFPYLTQIDQVLILTVHPGKYGSPFLPETLKKVKALRNIFNGDIEVDGGQNPKNAKKSFKAGANVIASGSFVQKSKNKKESIQKLRQIMK